VMVPLLRKGELDLVINYYMTIQVEDVVCEHLYHDEYVVCAAKDHRLANRKRIGLNDLVDEPWAWSDPSLGSQQKWREALRDAGWPAPRVGLECRSTALRLRSVAQSDLIDFTSLAVVRQLGSAGIVILPVKELSWHRSIGLLRRNTSYQPRVVER